MNPEAVFKAYDVRGRTDLGELDADLCRRAGIAFVRLLGATEIAVGRDCRESSDDLFAGLADGIQSAGADVIDLGQVPTDLVYYYSGANSVPGVMITASHNPPEYNGLKFCRSGAGPVGADSGLNEIRDAVISGVLINGDRGSLQTVDAVDEYVDHLFSIVDPDSLAPISVAIDGGNGMAGVALGRVFDRIAPTLTGLYIEPDGTFPNHPADPIQPENLVDLIDLVTRQPHQLAVAFDGDADRAFFLDDQGVALSGSTVTALIARWMLQRHPGEPVVHNLITSRAVPEIILEAGGRPIRTRVGHSFIKKVMADTGAVFGGEHSGHYYFRDNFRADSGMLAMLVLLRVLSESGLPLSELRTEVERYHASGEINFAVRSTADSIAEVAAAFPEADQDRLDGLTVGLEPGWFNLRPSNTEPLLRLNVEAPTVGRVQEIVEAVSEIVGRG